MSRLEIVHETVYRYRHPVSFGPHRLVVRPREGHDVNIVGMRFDVSPRHDLRWSRDVFGNSIATLSFEEPADVLRIASHVVLVRTLHSDEPYDRVRSLDYPVTYDPLEVPMSAVYLAPSFVEDVTAVQGFVFETLGLPKRGDVAKALPALNEAIKTRFPYRRREERGTQTPAETLALGSGSCRDKATLFMDAARALGIAARFVSGYLDCPASEVGRAATHAWAEVYLPESGWCGYDPTLGETTSHKHVVVGVSNHPRGVMPVSGRFSGDRADYLGMEVSVRIARVDT